MAMSENDQPPDVMRRIFTIRNGSLVFLAFCVGVTFVSVGMTAFLAVVLGSKLQGQMGTLGQMFESVNTVFSGLGFIALVVTFRLQYDELRLQRQELASQRQSMDKTQSELRRSAEADMRTCHVELMKMSMDDDDLAEVWPEFQSGLDVKLSKQYAYANLVIQHQRMLNDLGFYTDDDSRRMFHYLFSSPLIRGFWEARQSARQLIVRPGTAEWEFEQLIDLAYGESRDTRTAPPPPPNEGDGSAPEPRSDAA